MCRNAVRIVLSQIAAIALLFCCASPAGAQQVSVLNAGWEGTDYVIRFSDSLTYTVDLAASDSMLVLNFSRPITVEEGNTTGPNGAIAAFSRNPGDSMVTLTVRKQNRVEYSTLWRPYSHRLIVHTFNSDSLESQYAANQYHLGLLALEQGLQEQGRSYLSSALAFDNGEVARRASSILGVMYAREGMDSLAARYLTAPFDADDFMARAELKRRAGDSAGAKKDEEAFRQKMGEMGDSMEEFVDSKQAAAENVPATDDSNRPPIAKIFDDWRGILLVAIAALLIIVLAFWFSRRPVAKVGTESQKTVHHDHHSHHHTHQPPQVSQERATEPVQTPVIATPPSPPPVATEPIAPVRTEQAVQPEAAPEAVISATHSPEITTPPQQPLHDVVEQKRTEENAQLPQPNALPDHADGAEVYQTHAEATAIEPEGEKKEPTPSTNASRRGSAQADQLRQRMEAARSNTSQAPTVKPAAAIEQTEHESTITEARRLNVSRDYVELRNRIADLRKRIEES